MSEPLAFGRRAFPDAPVAELAQLYTTLTEQGGGAYWHGSCPAHPDRHPSFSVQPAVNSFRCFSCGAAGVGAVAFLRWVEGCSTTEAMAKLAQMVHDTDGVIERLITRRDDSVLVSLAPRQRRSWAEILDGLRDEPWWEDGETGR